MMRDRVKGWRQTDREADGGGEGGGVKNINYRRWRNDERQPV